MTTRNDEWSKIEARWKAPHDRVCGGCIDEDDLVSWIVDQDGPPGCDFCGGEDLPTVDLYELGAHIRQALEQNYGDANSDLPYDSGEGGYQSETWSTYDVLLDDLGISFPRKDADRLISFLCEAVSDQLWCKFDWTRLDVDEALKISWRELCDTVKHHRRFFFVKPQSSTDPDDDDDQIFGPSALLAEISRQLTRTDVIRTLPAGSVVYRARPDDGKGPYVTPADLGSPPPEKALQTNRMNPVGIPMFYGADTLGLTMDEIRHDDAFVGRFRLLRSARILDLSAIPHAPGIFSGLDRALRLGLVFLRAFERDIMQPVDRSVKAHVDYLPSQVVTEYFREFGAAGGPIDGIRYRSVVSSAGLNVVLFATQENIHDALPPAPYRRDIWLELVDYEHHRSET